MSSGVPLTPVILPAVFGITVTAVTVILSLAKEQSRYSVLMILKFVFT